MLVRRGVTVPSGGRLAAWAGCRFLGPRRKYTDVQMGEGRRSVRPFLSVVAHSRAGAPGSRRAMVRLLRLTVAALLLSGLLPAAAVPIAGHWGQYRNGPAHQGLNAHESILSPANVPDLGVAWTGATRDSVVSSPAVADGVVYVGSLDHKLYAFAVGCNSGGGTCSPLWTGSTGGGIVSSPAVADGVVYVGSNDHKLYAFPVGCASGGGRCSPLWTGATGGSIDSSPAVADGVVYVGSYDHTLYAFPVGCASGGGTCRPLWTGATGDAIVRSSPAVADGTVYVGSLDHKLYAFPVGCARGGGICTPLWTGATGDAIWSSPAVADGVVYVGSYDHKLYAFAVGCASGGGTCTPLWTGATTGGIGSSPAVANGAVYVGSWDGKLYAFPVGCASGGGTCTPLWTAFAGINIGSSPAVANGVVYVGSADGKLGAFAVGCASGGGTCRPLWTATTGDAIDSSPAIAEGVVYLGSEDGKLYALGLDHRALDHLILSPSSATIAAGASRAYTAEGFDAYGNSWDVTSVTTFTVSGAGSCTGASCTSTVASDHTVIGTEDGATGTATLHVIHATLDHLVLSPPGATIAAGASQTYTAEGFDAYGNSLGDVTSATTFTIRGAGSCTGPSCMTTVASDCTVTGTDGGAFGTAMLNVTPAEATTLTVSGVSSPRNAGTAGTVTVAAKDPYGNLATGYRGTIRIASTDPAAILPTDYKFTAADAGTHIFSVTLKTAGTQAIRARDILTATVAGAQYGIVVTPAAAALTVSGLSSPRTAGTAGNLTITAKDSYGKTATGYLGTIRFTSTDPAAVLPADYTFTAADTGTHIFSVTLKTAGTQTVSARDTITNTITGAQSGIVVTPAPATTLVVSGLSSPRTAGVADTITVTAQDAFGNIATGYRGTIGFTSTDSKAVLPVDYTFTAADAGTHIFSVILKTAGSQAVRARDTVTTSITAAQGGIVVTPAAATTLTLSGLSSPRTAGTAGNLTVTAKDVYGNTATGYLGTIRFTSTDSKAVLPADYTFTAADAGTHTFSITLKTAGSQGVRARDTVTTSITGARSGIVVS